MSNYNDERCAQLISAESNTKKNAPCPQLPGTLLRIFIPAGAVINLLNLIEITTPSGICLIVRIPLLGDIKNNSKVLSIDTIKDIIERAGGTIEFID